MTNSFRTFVAIELPRDLRVGVMKHIERLRREFPEVRASWSREDNLHLTLKFLGDVSIATIPKLALAVDRATRDTASFELIVSGCDAFPTRERPNVLWLGIDTGGVDINPLVRHPTSNTQCPFLSDLHAALEDTCTEAGFARDARAFHPHLTIARVRKPQGGRQLAERHTEIGFPATSFMVSELVIFRSELLPDGSRHTSLSRHRLASTKI